MVDHITTEDGHGYDLHDPESTIRYMIEQHMRGVGSHKLGAAYDALYAYAKLKLERDAAIARAKACAIDYNSAIESQVKISGRLRYELENMRGYKDACESDLDTARAAHAEAIELLKSAENIEGNARECREWFNARDAHLAKYGRDASK